MKKLLALLLVLGLASTANALVVQLSYNDAIDGPENVTEVTVYPSDYFEFDVHSDGDNIAYDEWVTVSGPASGFTQANGVIHAAAGQDAFILDVGRPGYLWVEAADLSDPFDSIDPGKHFSWELHCEGPGDVIIELRTFDDFEILQDTIIVHQIPEPASMLLLGLGGLLLRRRK